MNDFDPLSQAERDAHFESGGDPKKDKPRDPRPFVRSSRDAPPAPARHPTLGVPVASYLYTDELGAASLFVQRFEFPHATKKKRKRKVFIQWSLRQDAASVVWVSEGFPDNEQLPLYNLPEISAAAPDALIVLVEGEAKGDAARVIFGDTAVITTTAMGANSFPRTDATPLAGRGVLIWGDNDAAGQRYVQTATSVLHKLGCSIRVVDVAELVKIEGGESRATHDTDGWDCADALLEWTDPAALRAKVLELAIPAPAPAQNGRDLDAEREAIVKLTEGDLAPFVARTKVDPGFPFEPQAIAALNSFSWNHPSDFERLRARLKAETKVRLTALEAALKAEDAEAGPSEGMAGRPIFYDEIEPWPEAVNGAQLLSELSGAIGAYVVMDGHQRDAVALWVVFAHAYDLRDYAPLLIIVSPLKRCGKTRLQETLARLTPRPQPTNSISAALFARLIEKHHPTLFIDEFDAMARGDREVAEALRGQLNSSFNKRSAVVLRLVPAPNEGWQERAVFDLGSDLRRGHRNGSRHRRGPQRHDPAREKTAHGSCEATTWPGRRRACRVGAQDRPLRQRQRTRPAASRADSPRRAQ
jgi:hypothetical protein